MGIGISCLCRAATPTILMSKVQVWIDDEPQPTATWGYLRVPLAPGEYRVRLSRQSPTQPEPVDPVSARVAVREGRITELLYYVPQLPIQQAGLTLAPKLGDAGRAMRWMAVAVVILGIIIALWITLL